MAGAVQNLGSNSTAPLPGTGSPGWLAPSANGRLPDKDGHFWQVRHLCRPAAVVHAHRLDADRGHRMRPAARCGLHFRKLCSRHASRAARVGRGRTRRRPAVHAQRRHLRGTRSRGVQRHQLDLVRKRSSAAITRDLSAGTPLIIPDRFIDDGSALYMRSAVAVRLAYLPITPPAAPAGHWIRFPSWPTLSTHEYDADYSKLTQYPGNGGSALESLTSETLAVLPEGASCGLLISQLRTDASTFSHATPSTLDGRATLTFTMPVFTAGSRIRSPSAVTRRSGCCG
jgi:hypothetical protein